MRVAADFRKIARDTLNGKWKIAVLVGFIAMLLGAVEGMSPEVKLNLDFSGANASFEFAGQTLFSIGGGFNSNIGAFLAGGFTVIMIAAVFMSVVYFALGSIIAVGYAKFNLNLLDNVGGSFDTLFSYFAYWKTTVATRFLKSMYILFWTCLFVIPGVIASYSYAMTEYILAEQPYLSANEAIHMSKQMMNGNKWRFFCLQISFIGWSILCSFTFGIGNLWLTPYKQAAMAAFYREVSGTERNCFETNWN